MITTVYASVLYFNPIYMCSVFALHGIVLKKKCADRLDQIYGPNSDKKKKYIRLAKCSTLRELRTRHNFAFHVKRLLLSSSIQNCYCHYWWLFSKLSICHLFQYIYFFLFVLFCINALFAKLVYSCCFFTHCVFRNCHVLNHYGNTVDLHG